MRIDPLADWKTKPENVSVDAFLEGVEDEQKRADSQKLLALMREVTGIEPRMWGSSMIGFGQYHYRYPSGREGDWFLTGFSPRKANLSIHVMSGLHRHRDLLARLGKFSTGQSCLYVKRLSDIDIDALRSLLADSVRLMAEEYP